MKGKIDKYAITIGDFNPFSKTGRTATQKITKEIEDLNTIKKHNLTDKYRTPNTTRIHFVAPSIHGTCTKVDHTPLSWAIKQVSINFKELK